MSTALLEPIEVEFACQGALTSIMGPSKRRWHRDSFTPHHPATRGVSATPASSVPYGLSSAARRINPRPSNRSRVLSSRNPAAKLDVRRRGPNRAAKTSAASSSMIIPRSTAGVANTVARSSGSSIVDMCPIAERVCDDVTGGPVRRNTEVSVSGPVDQPTSPRRLQHHHTYEASTPDEKLLEGIRVFVLARTPVWGRVVVTQRPVVQEH